MEINTSISHKGWDIEPEDAKTYLHYYPRVNKEALSKWINANLNDNFNVLDIGCGNAQFYSILKEYNSNFRYTGIDNSENLVNEGTKVVGNQTVIKTDIYKYMNQISDCYDICILSHMIECIESPEYIINKASKICKYISILWYDYPTYDYDTTFIINQSSDPSILKLITRRKMSKDYWNHIINKNNLHLVYSTKNSEKDVLEIYQQK